MLKGKKFVIYDVNRLKTKEYHIIIKNVTVNDNLLSKLPICTSISCHFHKLGQIYNMLLISHFYNGDKGLFFLAYYVCETKTHNIIFHEHYIKSCI